MTKVFTITISKLLDRMRTKRKRIMSQKNQNNCVMERKKRLIERRKYVIVGPE